MKYIIDSSAWIEYLKGSEIGKKVAQILEEDNEIYIIPLNISEVVSKIKKENSNAELAYEVLVSNANLVEITPKIAKEAGLLHAQLKKKTKNISLIDTLIMCVAKSMSGKILTTDNHFKNSELAILI